MAVCRLGVVVLLVVSLWGCGYRPLGAAPADPQVQPSLAIPLFANRSTEVGLEAILLLVSPMVPHIAEELWQALGHTTLVLDVPWPQPQAEALTVSALTVVIQVNGKVRSRMVVPASATDEEIKNWALNDPAIEKWLKGQPPKKVILARRKLVSIVV